MAVTSQGADRALLDALGKRPLDRHDALPINGLADFEAAWTLFYMIRCAFAHDPFNPRWECRGRYLGTLRVTALGLSVDLRSRNGQRFQSAELGGLGGYLSLFRFLHDQTADSVAANQRVMASDGSEPWQQVANPATSQNSPAPSQA